jgi:tetratricopeptide (TPR) repeat protein
MGDGARALQNYKTSLAIFESLVASDPQNATARRDLAITYKRYGDELTWNKNPHAALENYQKSLAIYQAIYKTDPNNLNLRAAIAGMYQDVGDAYGHPEMPNLGNSAKALEYYRKSLVVFKELVAIDSLNVENRRSLLVSYNKIGDMLKAAGKYDEAADNYRQALAIAEAIAKTDLENSEARSDLAVSYEVMGEVLIKSNHPDRALDEFNKSMAIRQELLAKDSTNFLAFRDVVMMDIKFGEAYAALGAIEAAPDGQRVESWKTARARFQRSLESLLKMQSDNKLQESDVELIEKVKAAIARCDAALKG